MQDIRLSVSKCKTFSDCKKKFKFDYVLKYPQKDEDYHILGKFCHKILEDFHNEYINGSIEPYNKVMSTAFKNACLEYKDKMSQDMKKECRNLIDKYLQIMYKSVNDVNKINVLACEKSFALYIAENVVLNGVIDRVQLDHDGVLHICDYKTTKNKKYLKEDWLQLMTYGYVMLLENPDIKKIRASYILLRHDYEYISKEFSSDELLSVKDIYNEYAKKILSENEFNPNPTFLCGWCPFLAHCEEGKLTARQPPKCGEITY